MIVSIIVPVYKAEKYLPALIDSALAQTHKEIELVLVDDGSPDKSGAICDEYAQRDSRIKVVHQVNQGQGAARNAGIEAAGGEYICFADADDYISADLVEHNLKLAQENNLDIVFYGYYREIIHSNGEMVKKPVTPQLSGIMDTNQVHKSYGKICHGGASICNKLIRRRIVIENNIRIHTMVGEDDLMTIQLLSVPNVRIGFNQNCYYHYVLHEGSIMNRYNPKAFDQVLFLAQEFEKAVKSFGPVSETNQTAIYRYYLKPLSYTMGFMSEKSCPLSKREKLQAVRAMVQNPNIAQALNKINLNEYSAARLLQIKMWLLKRRLYRSAIWLGELKRNVMRE